jgi:hypothetical protein
LLRVAALDDVEDDLAFVFDLDGVLEFDLVVPAIRYVF